MLKHKVETYPVLDNQAQTDVLEALFTGTFPSTFWDCQDDLCDCTYQRIGMWTNPYLAETLEVRMCCIWAELYKMFPQFVRVTPAYLDGNAKAWATEPMAWNGEAEMPKAIWYRQLARQQGRTVEDIRAEYSEKDELRPRGKPKSVPLFVHIAGEWRAINLASKRTS